MSTTVQNIIDFIDSIAPFKTAEIWDNVGLLVGNHNQEVSNILLSLDLTEEVINEAVERKVDLIITHHPIIFNGIKTITIDSRVGNIIHKLIENGISVIAAHTNLDRSFEFGINRHIAHLYNLKNVQVLNEEHGFGVIGELEIPLDLICFNETTKNIFNSNVIKVANLIEGKLIRKVAISSGASADYIEDALNKFADVFITSDLKYHEAQRVLGFKMTLVDVGHFESEFLFLDPFSKLIESHFSSGGHAIHNFVTKSEKPIFKYL